MLPVGSPTAGLICAYNGLNGAAFALRSHARLDATRAGRLAVQAAAIDLAHTVGDVVSCPNDDGTEIVVAFAYAGGAHAALWVHDTGCHTVSNGTIEADDYLSLSSFIDAVTTLLPH